jgi:hypothetical protein
MIEINKLLPEEIKKVINELEKILSEKENSKNTIGEVADLKKEVILCPKCNSQNI